MSNVNIFLYTNAPAHRPQKNTAFANKNLVVISLHFMKKHFYHENTKLFLASLRVFVISCFRD